MCVSQKQEENYVKIERELTKVFFESKAAQSTDCSVDCNYNGIKIDESKYKYVKFNRQKWPSIILDDLLYLGDYGVACNPFCLSAWKIKVIINCTSDRINIFEGCFRQRNEFERRPSSNANNHHPFFRTSAVRKGVDLMRTESREMLLLKEGENGSANEGEEDQTRHTQAEGNSSDDDCCDNGYGSHHCSMDFSEPNQDRDSFVRSLQTYFPDFNIMKYHRVSVEDNFSADISKYFDTVVAWIGLFSRCLVC